MLVLGGNAHPTAADVEKVLTAAGIKADSDRTAALIAAFEGKDFHNAVQDGLKQMSSMGGSAPASAAAPTKVETKVAEAPKEEEIDVDMGDLFGY